MLSRGKLTCAVGAASEKGQAPLVPLMSGGSEATQLLGEINVFGGITIRRKRHRLILLPT